MYVPPEGMLIRDIESAWLVLEKAEHDRELALRQELIRQERLEQLAVKFEKKVRTYVPRSTRTTAAIRTAMVAAHLSICFWACGESIRANRVHVGIFEQEHVLVDGPQITQNHYQILSTANMTL